MSHCPDDAPDAQSRVPDPPPWCRMTAARRLRLLAELHREGAEIDAQRLCVVGADVTATSGAGIMLMSGDIPSGSLGSTDGVSALIEELQFTLGEGPCIDAHLHDRPVVESDLTDRTRLRWPAFTPPAIHAGVRAVFGFPLRIGRVRVGALDLYRNRGGNLTDDQHADALELADIATRAVLLLQASAATGAVAVELERGAEFHLVVHQATGMVAAQLGSGVTEAFVRLRAHAFADGRPVEQVAEDVVSRRLRFDDPDRPRATADGQAPG